MKSHAQQSPTTAVLSFISYSISIPSCENHPAPIPGRPGQGAHKPSCGLQSLSLPLDFSLLWIPWGSQWCLSPQITTRGPITPLPMDFVLAWHEVSGCSPNFHSWVVCRGCSAPAAEPWLMKPIQDDLVPLWKVLNCLVSLAAKTGCVTQSVNVKVKVNKTYREIC